MIKEKYSYSRLETYINCPFCYKRKYVEKNFLGGESIVTALGTLVHDNQELIALSLKEKKTPDYKALTERFMEIDLPKKNPYDTEGGIFGIKVLRAKYTEEYFKPSDKTGLSYHDKINSYLQSGMYRLEQYLNDNPDIEVWDVEHPFEFLYAGNTIKGFIDRVLFNKQEQQYILHDIKTRDRLFDKSVTTTPLQLIIYALALQNELKLTEPPTQVAYDLVFLSAFQQAGTKGFIGRGYKKLDKIFDAINDKNFAPKPSPLCYWCDFSNTNPNVTEEGKNMCPYYSLWTPQNTSFQKFREWEGEEKVEEHLALMKGEGSQKYADFVL